MNFLQNINVYKTFVQNKTVCWVVNQRAQSNAVKHQLLSEASTRPTQPFIPLGSVSEQ